MKKEITVPKIGYYGLEMVAGELNVSVEKLKIVGIRVNHKDKNFTVLLECPDSENKE